MCSLMLTIPRKAHSVRVLAVGNVLCRKYFERSKTVFGDTIFEGVDSPRNVGLAFEPLLLNENEMHLTAEACGQADENRAALPMRVTWGRQKCVGIFHASP